VTICHQFINYLEFPDSSNKKPLSGPARFDKGYKKYIKNVCNEYHSIKPGLARGLTVGSKGIKKKAPSRSALSL